MSRLKDVLTVTAGVLLADLAVFLFEVGVRLWLVSQQ